MMYSNRQQHNLTTDRRLWAGPYLFKGTYAVAAGMSCAGTLTRWFRENMAIDLERICQNDGSNIYEKMMAVGGGTKNCIWLQAVSDISGKRRALPRLKLAHPTAMR